MIVPSMQASRSPEGAPQRPSPLSSPPQLRPKRLPFGRQSWQRQDCTPRHRTSIFLQALRHDGEAGSAPEGPARRALQLDAPCCIHGDCAGHGLCWSRCSFMPRCERGPRIMVRPYKLEGTTRGGSDRSTVEPCSSEPPRVMLSSTAQREPATVATGARSLVGTSVKLTRLVGRKIFRL